MAESWETTKKVDQSLRQVLLCHRRLLEPTLNKSAVSSIFRQSVSGKGALGGVKN